MIKSIDVEKAAQEYWQNPKNCMPGFVPMGHTGTAFIAGAAYLRRGIESYFCGDEPACEVFAWLELAFTSSAATDSPKKELFCDDCGAGRPMGCVCHATAIPEDDDGELSDGDSLKSRAKDDLPPFIEDLKTKPLKNEDNT